MKNIIKEYIKEKLIIFSIDVKQKKHKNGNWKKEINFPPKWSEFTLQNTYINEKYNGIALLTGKINNLIIIDIDNIGHWEKLLKEHDEEEPNTIKVISGSGGLHYYFQYDKEFEHIKSKDHCFGKNYDIDIKTNGGCIIAPPTKYFNKNLNKNVEYQWENSIFDYELSKIPDWIKKLLLEKKEFKKVIKKEIIDDILQNNVENNIQNLEINEEVPELNFTINEIEYILSMLNDIRFQNYNDWLNVGICLYNINFEYWLIWEKWSQQSEKYQEGMCKKKWIKLFYPNTQTIN